MKLKVTINGKAYEAEQGEYIMDLCRRSKILVPSLCHHEGLPGLGSCRLCVVEVNEGGGKKVVVSCVYPLSRDCRVFTESKTIRGIRKTILSMLKTRAPLDDRLASLCQTYGVESDPESASERAFAHFTAPNAGKQMASSCVVCGLCARACASLGAGAISTVGRGVAKEISTPYEEPSADCIGCGSCAAVCPTKAIECTETKEERFIWGRKFRLLRCASCGTAFATEEEYALALKKAGLLPGEEPAPPLCDICRKKKSADVMAAAFGERTR